MNSVKRIMAGFMILLTFILSASMVSADEEKCRLSIHYMYEGQNITGAEFSLYRIGESDENGEIKLSKDLETLPLIQSDDLSQFAQTLYGFIIDQKMEKIEASVTDGNGIIEFKSLDKGVYLVIGHRFEAEEKIFVSEPQIVFLPGQVENSNEEVYDVMMLPKASVLGKEKRSIKVLKEWEDDDKVYYRPESIEVRLYKDETLHETVTLDEASNWRWSWENLDAGHMWTVVEIVPDNYNVLIRQEGITYVIKNTCIGELITETPAASPTPTPQSSDTPKETDTPKTTDAPNVTDTPKPTSVPVDRIPQTGALWWPVPLLLVAGIVFITIGIARRRNGNEEAK